MAHKIGFNVRLFWIIPTYLCFGIDYQVQSDATYIFEYKEDCTYFKIYKLSNLLNTFIKIIIQYSNKYFH